MSVNEDSHILQRINYGVVFKEEAHLHLAKESWLHTFKIELPVAKLDKFDNFCVKYTPDCNDMKHFVNHIQHSSEVQLSEIIKSIHVLIPQANMLKSNRNVRSFLPFIGSLAKGLFGTATMSDVELLARHINALNRRTQLIGNALHQHGDHLSSFMSIVDTRTTNLMKGIHVNANEIAAIANQVNVSLLTLQHSMINMSKVLTSLTNNANLLRANLEQFLISVQSLVEGKLSPLLLPKHTLTSTLNHINAILAKSYPGFYLTQFHPHYYYTNAKFMFMRNDSVLYITLRFPVSSLPHPLRMYKVISLPVPINNTLKHATKSLSLPDFFAVTHQHDYYVSLSSKDLTNCQHTDTITCSMNIALTPSHVQTCEWALFNNDMKQVKQYCEFRFLENHLTHDLIELSSTSVLVYMSETLALECPGKQTLLPDCQFCVVNLPCKCSLASTDLYLSPRLVQCFNSTNEVTVLHPVNLALLQEFFNEDILQSITGDSLFGTPVTMSIPSFNFYKHNVSNILADDQQTHLSLKKMVKAASNDEMIFKTLTEPLLDGQISLESQWPDLNAILIFVTLGIGIFSVFISVYLFCKMRKMATAMLVMQQISNTKSQTVPSFILHKVTETPAPYTPSDIEIFLKSEFSWVHASVVLSILVLIFLSVLVCYLYRTRKSKCTKIYLEITTGGDCVMIPILNLSLCPSYYDFSMPSVDDITLSSFPSCKMYVIYSSFIVKNKYTLQSVTIPTTIDIKFLSYFRLKRILSQPFNAYVLITHQGFASTLNFGTMSKAIPSEPLESSLALYPKL